MTVPLAFFIFDIFLFLSLPQVAAVVIIMNYTATVTAWRNHLLFVTHWSVSNVILRVYSGSIYVEMPVKKKKRRVAALFGCKPQLICPQLKSSKNSVVYRSKPERTWTSRLVLKRLAKLEKKKIRGSSHEGQEIFFSTISSQSRRPKAFFEFKRRCD